MEIIRKTKKSLKVKPILKDYEKTYRNFKWKDVEKEIAWFPGRKINAAYVAIDRHANTKRKNKVALYWEGESGESKKYTFQEMAELSNKFANVLKKLKIKKGDRVFIFLPRIPELYISFIGILKTGAIVGTMFSAFGSQGLKDRLKDSGAKYLITNSNLKNRLYEIARELPELKYVIITDGVIDKKYGFKEIDYNKEMKKASEKFNIEKMKPDDRAFILYTSGSTGKPKGVCHSHKAILYEHITAKWILDIHENDILWTTADPGWVTGVAYGILGTWSNGVSSLVYEGRFNPKKWYSLIEKYNITIWYTAPTAIRMLEADGSVYKKFNLKSLRHICSVGEPLNPEPIKWGMKAYGLPFHDNYWQTETGGILISNYPCMPIKLGSMGKPFPGIVAAIVDDKGKKLPANREGNLVIKPGWPSQMKEIWKNPRKFRSYFKKGWYFTGDRAFKDKDGYYWFVGRADDVIKTAGERVGPFEVESALVEHPAVVEAAVIGKPDPMRGEIIKAFLVLKKRYTPSKELEEEIKQFVKKKLAGHAYPREIAFVDSLPKTRSGKIMRRVLKAKELGLPVGDLSSMEKQ